jgi:hypothetical protein
MIQQLTLANLKSYAAACEALCLKLIDLSEQGFVRMVVPSRGAAPLEQGASAYFHTEWRPLHKPGAEKLAATKAYASGPMLAPMYLPFTADIPAKQTGVESRDIRRFWSAVLAAIVRGDQADPYYSFFDFLRTQVCVAGFPHRFERAPLGPSFIFLDTVVSGRAVCEIADAFDEFGLDQCHYVLIVDRNGQRLKPRYRQRLESLVYAGRATMIYLDQLFTEDQGPAVSGIWSVTMPDIMDIARNEIPEFSHSEAIGAGLYYHEIRARDDQSNIDTTSAIASLASLINFVWSPYITDDWVEYDLARLRKHLRARHLLKPATTVETARPVLFNGSKAPINLAASSSHAIRLHHDRDVAARLVRTFRDGGL